MTCGNHFFFLVKKINLFAIDDLYFVSETNSERTTCGTEDNYDLSLM